MKNEGFESVYDREYGPEKKEMLMKFLCNQMNIQDKTSYNT